MITPKLNVNDQISLALASKPMAVAVVSDQRLACNTSNPHIRFESWRFKWLPLYAEKLTGSPEPLFSDWDMTVDSLRKLKQRRLKRCRRKARNDMMARLKVRQRIPARIEVGGTGEGSEESVDSMDVDYMSESEAEDRARQLMLDIALAF